MQGAGKSTVADLLARRFERSARVNADALQRLIVAGGRWPEQRAMSAEAARQLRLRLKHACLLATSFVDAGFTAVIDDIVIGERLDELLAELAGRRFVFVMLTPRLGAVMAREAGRGTQLWEAWGWMDEEVRSHTRRLGLWLDTSNQTADETVDEILRRAPAEGWVEAPPSTPSTTGKGAPGRRPRASGSPDREEREVGLSRARARHGGGSA
jgi:chloramphenicol 3-O-phosphotransferase